VNALLLSNPAPRSKTPPQDAARTYSGRPVGQVRVHDQNGTRPLALRLDLRNHSPTGFAWGYGGSGPAQLALALLADALGDDERALQLYQAFKFRVTANFGVRWQIDRTRVLLHVEAIEHDLARKRAP
jgi:Family of unknown function (DUF6166)